MSMRRRRPPDLIGVLRGRDAGMREAAADALGQIGPEAEAAARPLLPLAR